MGRYRVYRESGKVDEVVADRVQTERDAIVFYRRERHGAQQDCTCERYNRQDEDGELVDHIGQGMVAAYAAEYWRRVEQLDAG